MRNTELTTQRLEALSDGVFAIAITLLILDIRLPTQVKTGDQSLIFALLSIWPSYFAYISSFLVVGIYWVNHHYIFGKIYQKTDHFFNLLNILFLLCISFLPFPTAVLGTHLLSLDKQQTAIIFYIFGLLLPSVTWFFSWYYACSYELIDPTISKSFINYLTKKYALSIFIYLLAILLTLWQPVLGLFMAVGLTVSYIRPPKQPVHKKPPL